MISFMVLQKKARKEYENDRCKLESLTSELAKLKGSQEAVKSANNQIVSNNFLSRR